MKTWKGIMVLFLARAMILENLKIAVPKNLAIVYFLERTTQPEVQRVNIYKFVKVIWLILLFVNFLAVKTKKIQYGRNLDLILAHFFLFKTFQKLQNITIWQ